MIDVIANRPRPIRPSLAESATPDEFAAAMVACQGYAPACSDAHECFDGGQCFGRDGKGFASAKKKLMAMIDNEGELFTRSWLKIALDALEHHHFQTARSLDARKIIAINQKVRSLYKETP